MTTRRGTWIKCYNGYGFGLHSQTISKKCLLVPWMAAMRAKLYPRLFYIFLGILPLIISACGAPRLTPTSIAPTSPRPSTPLPSATARPAEPSQAVASPTPTQESITFLPTTFEQPGKWHLRHPYANPDAPILFAPSTDGYALTHEYQVASIELSYRWIGIGDSVAKFQRIEKRNGDFWNNNSQISTTAVEQLVQSIAHLRQEPQALSAIVWTDDYPFWAIELTSTSGDKVLLYSDSNSPSYIPWNVIYNGEIYSQYDGAIPAALDGLFKVFEDRPIASTYGDREVDYLPATTYEGPPAQITQGFSGLLPIYRYFSYFADPQKNELSGYLSDYSWSSRVGGAEINWLTGLKGIDLDIRPGQTISCSLEGEPTDDAEWVYWKFSCPIGNPPTATTYRYPIRLTYTTSTGQPYILSGELFGYWETSATIPLIAYPQEIGEILDASPVAADLMGDHLLYVNGDHGLAEAATGVITHQWTADVVLLGQAQLGSQVIPYSVKFDDVVIRDGKLVTWDLDRAKLEALLKEVLDQPVTRRFLAYDPKGEIDLYYAEYSDYSIIHAHDLPACASLPEGKELPQPGLTMRGFSFNQSRSALGSGFYDMQLVFTDTGLRIFQLDLSPASPGDAYWMSVLPEALIPQKAPPFLTIRTRFGSPDINVLWSDQASPVEVSYYESMFAGWDVVRITEFDQGLRLNQRWYDLTPAGDLVLLNCKSQ